MAPKQERSAEGEHPAQPGFTRLWLTEQDRVVRIEIVASRRERVGAIAAIVFWWGLSVAIGSTWDTRDAAYFAGFAAGAAVAVWLRYDKVIFDGKRVVNVDQPEVSA